MFNDVSSHRTKLDKVSVEKKIVLTCSAAATLFFIKNPIVMFSIFFVAPANLFFSRWVKISTVRIVPAKSYYPFCYHIGFLASVSRPLR